VLLATEAASTRPFSRIDDEWSGTNIANAATMIAAALVTGEAVAVIARR
jgi:hypothetical protein